MGRSLPFYHLPAVKTRGADNLPARKDKRAVQMYKPAARDVDDVAAAEKKRHGAG